MNTGSRITLIDGFRGYFLMFMMVIHLTFQGGAWLLNVHQSSLFYVEDAQGFVFLSGLLIGLTYTSLLRRQGAKALRAKANERVLDLYRITLILLVVLLAAELLVPSFRDIAKDYLGLVAKDPLTAVPMAATLIYQPSYFDILPQYMLYILVAPPLVRLVTQGKGIQVLVGSAVIWLGAQLGWQTLIADGIDAVLHLFDPDAQGRAYFNPLGWQLIFVTGLVLGAALKSGQIDTARLLGPQRKPLALLCLGFVAMFMVYRVAGEWGLLTGEIARRFDAYIDRSSLSIVYVLNFASLAYIVAWTITNATDGAPALVRLPGQGLRWLFERPFFVLLGRHSLHVYAWHVLVAYAVLAIDSHYGPFDEWTKSGIIVLAVLSLLIPALLHEHHQKAAKARAAGRAGPEARPLPAGAVALTPARSGGRNREDQGFPRYR